MLRLYISGRSPRSARAVDVVEALARRVGAEFEVVDVLVAPARAEDDRILATPTLVKRAPLPPCKLIGELPDAEALAGRLGLAVAGGPA